MNKDSSFVIYHTHRKIAGKTTDIQRQMSFRPVFVLKPFLQNVITEKLQELFDEMVVVRVSLEKLKHKKSSFFDERTEQHKHQI